MPQPVSAPTGRETGVAQAGAAQAAGRPGAPRVRPSRSTPVDPAQAPAGPHAPEPQQADARAPRTGRVEVPVPSIVRARERGRLAEQNPVVLRTEMLTKVFGSLIAANEVSIDVHAGSFTGIVGPNGAGKTTTLSMISGLLRPTSGRVTVGGVDVWSDGPAAKRLIGTLPDRLRLFDRLTGAQLLYYSGVLHGVPEAAVAERSSELAAAFGLESALGRLVSDYSAGMQKKIALACSMIHAPEVLVLDEPFEAIDPVSASNVTEILEKYVAGGGSVVMSSHSLDLIQRVCDHVSIIVDGSVIAQGTVDAVRDGLSLEERFTQLTGTSGAGKGLEWLHGSSDSE
ncbi:ABC transporter ATP-binding protein [Leucobacter zeae]|nr:ABC transporter ATP-binding protein [Leucobacter zeae]